MRAREGEPGAAPGHMAVHATDLPLLDALADAKTAPGSRARPCSRPSTTCSATARAPRNSSASSSASKSTCRSPARWGYYVLPILHGDRLSGASTQPWTVPPADSHSTPLWPNQTRRVARRLPVLCAAPSRTSAPSSAHARSPTPAPCRRPGNARWEAGIQLPSGCWRRLRRRLRRAAPAPIADNPHVRQRHQAIADHGVDLR